MNNKNIIRIVVATGFLLLIPLLGQWPWTLSDFVIAGTFLLGSGLAYEFIASKGGTTAYRVATFIAVGATLLLTWINLAVGIIGNEENPANLMYFAVIIVGIIGTLVARFKPQGMTRALIATAVAQALVPIIAFTLWRPDFTPGVIEVFALNTIFVVLWLTSAFLFRRAGVRTLNAVA